MSEITEMSDSKNDKVVEFRFNCTYGLRDKINSRLKQLNLERADVMVEFLEEWLKETDKLIAAKASASASKVEPRI